MSLRAGKLTKLVEIQTRSASPTGVGDQPTSWSKYISGWAAIVPLSGKELMAAQAINSVATHLITMRFRSGVTTAMRVKYGTSSPRYFNIVSPPRNTEERGEEMVFEAEENLNQEQD